VFLYLILHKANHIRDIVLCERCSRDVYKHVVCNYCNKKICNDCMKSSKSKSRTVKLVICKDCWSKLQNRKTYKNTAVVKLQVEEERRYEGRRY